MVDRGKIIHPNRKKQIVDYSGIRYKNITPTDIDGYFEIQNKIFVFIELKLEGAPLLKGQRMALERLGENLRKPTLIIIAEHYVFDTQDEIIADITIVREYLSNGWRVPKQRISTKSLIDGFLRKNGLEEYI